MSQTPLNPRQQLALCQQIARLVHAKLPLVGELSRTAAECEPELAQAAQQVEDKLASGASLADALVGDQSRDSQILAACIQAGERSSTLDRTLQSWSEMYVANARSNRAMRTAMLYPCLLMLVTWLSLGFVIWKLIPEYRQTYVLFSQEMPGWLEAIVWVRERMGWLMILLLVLMFLPIFLWFWRRRGMDAQGIPRDPVQRLRLQSLAADLAGYLVAGGVPLTELVPLCTRAMHADQASVQTAFERLRNQQPVEPLPREVSMLLASLHAGLMKQENVAQQLHAVADHLRQSAELMATRNVRWAPMLVALIVGTLTILTYVLLIYLPWIALMTKIVTPDSLTPAGGLQ